MTSTDPIPVSDLPQVCVLCPATHDRLIGRCVRGVLSQSLESLELYLIDFTGSDRIAQVAREANDPRVRVFRPSGEGDTAIAEALNLALERTNASYVAIAAPHVSWARHKLALQVTDLHDSRVSLSASRVALESQDGVVLFDPFAQREGSANVPIGSAAVDLLDFRKPNLVHPATTLFRRRDLLESGGFESSGPLSTVLVSALVKLSLRGEWRVHEEALALVTAVPDADPYARTVDPLYAFAASFVRQRKAQLPASHEQLAALERDWRYFQAERLILLGQVLAREGKRAGAAEAFDAALRFELPARSRVLVGMARKLAASGLPPKLALMFRRRKSPLSPTGSGEWIVTPDIRPADIRPRSFGL